MTSNLQTNKKHHHLIRLPLKILYNLGLQLQYMLQLLSYKVPALLVDLQHFHYLRQQLKLDEVRNMLSLLAVLRDFGF